MPVFWFFNIFSNNQKCEKINNVTIALSHYLKSSIFFLTLPHYL